MATTSFKQVKNNAKGTVDSGDLNNTTDPVTFDVGGGEGANFPDTVDGSFYVTVWDSSSYPDPGDDSNMEIMLVTSRATDALTATRAQLDTSAVAHSGTPTVALMVVDQNLKDAYTAVNTLETAVMPGLITMYGGATEPSGWLLCNGQSVLRTTYANLFSAIGETFGAGNGTTTFNVPDMRNRMPIGAGDTYARNAAAGATTADLAHTHTTGSLSLSTSQIPAHAHSVNPPAINTGYAGNHTHTLWKVAVFAGGGGWGLNDAAWGSAVGAMGTAGNHRHYLNQGAFNSANTGSSGSHNHGSTGSTLSATQNILNPYRGVYFIIKT